MRACFNFSITLVLNLLIFERLFPPKMEKLGISKKLKKPDIETIKAIYDKFIQEVFQEYSQDFGENLEEKCAKIKQTYFQITDPNIERNELFLERLTDLKVHLIQNKNMVLIQDFVKVIYLLNEAEILNFEDFLDFISFQRYLKLDIKSTGDRPNQEMPSKVSYVNNRGDYIHYDPKISEDLRRYIASKSETEDHKKKKEVVLRIVDKVFKKINFINFSPNAEVTYSFYGSYVNKICLPNSDIDISINITPDPNHKKLLQHVHDQLKSYLSEYDPKITIVPQAEIPFVDITFQEYGLTVSFTVNNDLAVLNSRLVALYSSLDKRCEMLNMIVKIWAKSHDIISAKKRFLSSYAYNLMVINFLQTIEPPILPSLQRLREEDSTAQPSYLKIEHLNRKGEWELFDVRTDFEDNQEKLKQIMALNYSENKMTVIELLREFFAFYSDRSFHDFHTLSVKKGAQLKRNLSEDESVYFYSIEDPFDKFRNVGRHVKNEVHSSSSHASKILNAMEKSKKLIEQGKILEIFGSYL